MEIRPFREDDYPQAELLWKATGIYQEERGDSPGTILRCNRQGGEFLVMTDPSTRRIIGTSWLTFDGRRLFLHHFAIHPDFQGRGLGRILALHSLSVAHERGVPVKLEVHLENRPAIRLYESLGFKVFEDYGVFMAREPGKALEKR